MTDANQGNDAPAEGLSRFIPRSIAGKSLFLSFVICVVSSIFMAGILPVDSWFGAIGVASIYFVVMILMSATIKMIWGRFASRQASSSA